MRAFSAFFLLAALLGASSSTTPDRAQYICVNKGYGVPHGWLVTDPSTFTQSSIDELLAAFNSTRTSPDGSRRLCVSFNLWTLFGGAPLSTYLASLQALLALVEANDLPLSLSLDPTQWWQGRPDLFNWYDPAAPGYNAANVMNVEWSGPSPANATAISWRNWGSQFRMPTPHPNYASPAFRAAAAESMAPLASHLAAWYSALPLQRRYLLAYVRVSQELWIGTNYYYYPGGNALGPQPPAKDPTGGPGAALQLGYSALCSALGGALPPPPGCTPGDPLLPQQLDALVASFLSFSAGLLLDAGLPRSRLMVHTGSFFQSPPPCSPHTPAFPHPCAAFNTAAAALIPQAAPGWSMYGSDSSAASDQGVLGVLGALAGGPWGSPEWNIFKGSPEQWAAALAGTLTPGNNRLLVVQNFESIAGDAVACSAVREAVASGAQCLVDAPLLLPQPQRLNATAWAVAWALAGGSTPQSLALRASSTPATLPSGQLAVADVAELEGMAGTATAAVLALAQGQPLPVRVYWQVTAMGCNGTQRMASDAGVIELLTN
jgi:hypothetical protein